MKLAVSTSELSGDEESSSCDENFINHKPPLGLLAKSSHTRIPHKSHHPRRWIENVSSIDESRIPLYQRQVKPCSSNNKRRVMKWLLFIIILAMAVAVLIIYLNKDTSVFGFNLVSSFKNWSSTTTAHSKHKLHFWAEESDTESELEKVKTARHAKNQSTIVKNSTTAPIDIYQNTSINQKTTRVYDRLSILIDHDLFKKLNFKYLVSNETLE